MKMTFDEYLRSNNDDKFSYFINTLFKTNRTPKYWVNWNKVFKNSREVEISLNTLNYLVGKKNIKDEARDLFLEQPQLLKCIPILIASRDKVISVFVFDNINSFSTYNLDFKQPNINEIDKYIDFMDETGLLDFLSEGLNRSLVDYVFGVEVGLDSNGRKNRSGTQNELILELYLKDLCKKNDNLIHKEQVTGKWIEENWSINVPEVIQPGKKGGRRYDGAVYNSKNNTVTIIETNFYNGGGSKLKSVAGEFSSIYETSLRDAPNVKFAWLSDGLGWLTAKNPMREAFDVIPTIINLHMLEDGFMEDIIEMNKE
ncbi:type II restriction endonuclease [Lactobacillus sp. PSON]|uniref:type II restriction endonuclease n=1 Tax=Lactobacillus sp. PSON TaxID=3455454 RepID=UPI0040436825